jgi:hypothetical protein
MRAMALQSRLADPEVRAHVSVVIHAVQLLSDATTTSDAEKAAAVLAEPLQQAVDTLGALVREPPSALP